MMYKIIGLLIIFFACLSYTSVIHAQDLDSLLNVSAFTAESDLQKVLNKKVAVAALNLSSRESPSIISVITNEEIQNSGARDIVDVLRLVPGFDVSQDLQYVLGFSLRGSWANEGKVLVLLDGVPFNDLLYQTVAVGNRFPVDAIDRIEIIRGPGSAIYGGSAEYGVINIITRAATLNGVAVYGTGGFHADAVGRTNVGVMLGQKTDGVSWDVSLFKGKGIISDYTEGDFDMARESISDPFNVNVGLSVKGFSLRAMHDEFETSLTSFLVSFKNTFVDANYLLPVTNNFTLQPRLQYSRQVPWSYNYQDTPGVDFKMEAIRKLAQLDGNLKVSRKLNVSFGGVYFNDKSHDPLVDEDVLSLDNIALYAQALLKHRLANATVGFRFEKNNRYSGAFVPRIALTKKIENLHFKALYSKSFRAPSLQNVLLDTTGAKPERSNVFEFELGYQFTPEMLLSVNAFRITTRDVIIYGSEETEDYFKEWYENYEKSGSKGIEIVYSIKKKRWYTAVTYSYSQAIRGNTVDKYEVPQTRRQYVGIPQHKLTVNSSFTVIPAITINPSLVMVGKRYAFVSGEEGDLNSERLSPYTLLNLFVNYKPTFLNGFTLGAGVFDLLDERAPLPQTYNGGSGAYDPMPGRSREYVVKLSYQLNFKK